MTKRQRISIRLGPLQPHVEAFAESKQVNTARAVVLLVAEALEKPAPEEYVGNPKFGEVGHLGGIAKHKKKAKE